MCPELPLLTKQEIEAWDSQETLWAELGKMQSCALPEWKLPVFKLLWVDVDQH